MEMFIAPRAGIFCRSASGWGAFRDAVITGRESNVQIADPVPDLLPAREGRRAPLHVRIAIEAGVQTCRENGTSPADVVTVFASRMGDVQITDYMCRELIKPERVVSPTRFHNSVQNAASGYWSIGAANRRPGVAVAAGEFTFPAALLEAATLALCGDDAPVLLIAHDIQAEAPFDRVCPNRQTFAAGLLLARRRITPSWRTLGVKYRAAPAAWPETSAGWLDQLSHENDCARALPVLEALCTSGAKSIELPLGTCGSLALEIGPQVAPDAAMSPSPDAGVLMRGTRREPQCT